MLLSQIFDQTPAQRRDFMHQMGEPTHRKPGRITSTDVLAARRRFADYKPTHRGEPRPAIDELRAVNSNLGRTHG